MSDIEKSSEESIKNYYLNKKKKNKHRKVRLSTNNLDFKELDLKENKKKISAFRFPTSRNLLTYNNTENTETNTTNSNNNNFSGFHKNAGKKEFSKFMTNLGIDKFVSGITEKNKNYSNSNDVFENKFKQPVNKIIKGHKNSSLQIHDYNNYNNSLFVSNLPVKVNSMSRFKPDKEIFQKIGSMDILAKSNLENKNLKKKNFNVNYPYLKEKMQSINENFNGKDAHKKKRKYYPSMKFFNINTERSSNEDNLKFLDNGDDELSKKLRTNYSSDNRSDNDNKNTNHIINSYNYKMNNNNINSLCKPTIINDVTIKNKNEFNNFSNNFYTVRDSENLTPRNLINQAKVKKYSTNFDEDDSCKKLKMKLLKRYSVKKIIRKNELNLEPKKSTFAGGNINDSGRSICKKKTIMSLKNNIQFFNKLTGNKKLNDDNKNRRKISLFPSSRFLLNDEQIKEEEKKSDKSSDNKEITINNSDNISNESYSSKKEPTLNCINSDESEYTIKRSPIINPVNGNDKSNKNNNNNISKKENNNIIIKYNNEENESEDNENSIRDYLKGNKLMTDKWWSSKYDDENFFHKKKILKITSQLNKISKESYVFNTCEKEIKNNFLRNTVIENITKKMIENFGLKFLEEEKAEKIIKKRLLISDKNKPSKEGLKFKENNLYLYHIVKTFKSLYTQKIKTKYNFNLFRVQEILNMYETHLLKLMDNTWDEINGPYDYNMEKIKYICNIKEMKNKKHKAKDKLIMGFGLINKEKNDRTIKEKKIKKKILKNDKYFFTHLEEIQKELYFKTAYLHLRINILDFNMHDNVEKYKKRKRNITLVNLNKTSDKEITLKTGKSAEIPKPTTNPPPKKLKSLKSIINPFKKRHSILVTQPKKKISLRRGNTLNTQILENDLSNKMEPLTYLFRSTRYISNIKHLNKFNRKELLKEIKNEEKYLKDVEEKEKKLKSTENTIIGLNVLKNKNIFTKDYEEDSFDIERKIKDICKSRQKRRNFGRNSKTDAIIIKSCGYDLLTREAASIKTQELENDLPDVKLFEKFVVIIQERNFNLFVKNIDKEGDKFFRIINRRDLFSGNTMLYFATKNKLLNFMKLLLLKGANPNIQNNFGNTPLHLAYKFNSSFMINLLLEYNANKQLENSDGLLPPQMSKYVND